MEEKAITLSNRVINMNTSSSNSNRVFYWIIPAYFILLLGQARGIIPLSGYFTAPFLVALLYYGLISMHFNYKKNKLLLVFIAYSLFTVTSYMIVNRPLSLFLNDCIYFVIPILIAFVGMDKREVSNKFYDYLFWACLLSFAIGYYIYFVKPSWYQSFYTYVMNTKWFRSDYVGFDDIVDSYRFSSFAADSYFTQYFGMFAFSLGLAKTFKSTDHKLLYLFFSLIILGAVLLSLQRSAIVCCILMIVAYFFYFLKNRKGQKTNNLKYIIYALIVLGIIVLALGASDVVQKVLFRFTQMGVDDAFEVEGSRTEQIQTTLASWENYVTGNGLGTAGSKARSMGYPGISDGNYIKLLVEEGIVGFVLFLVLMLTTFFRALKNFRYLSMECCVVGALIFAMLGSDALMFTYYIVPYWYVIGKVWNPDYLNYLKLNNISV